MHRFAVAALASVLVAQAGDLRILDAVRAENKTQLRTLLAQKADVNAVAEDGTAALHWAVDYDDLPVVAHPADVDKPGTVQLYPDIPGNICFDYEYGNEAGTDAAFASLKAKGPVIERFGLQG